jgi:hypothetical protein
MAVVNLDIDAERFIMNRRVTIGKIGTRTIMFNDDCEVQENYIDATCQIQKWIEDLGGDPADYLEKDAEIRSDGPIDNGLNALFFRSKETGRMIGSFVHFACHPVIVSQLRVKGEISPDYPGFLKKKIEQELGGVAVFGNGACGDIKPLNAEYSQSFARSFGEKLAAKLINAFPAVEWKPLSMVELLSEPVSVPIRDDFPATVEEAEEKIEALNSEYDRAETPFERRELQNLNRIYAFAAGGLINDLRPEWIEERKVMFLLYAIKLNDTAIVISNGEMFTRTGQAIIEPYKDKKPLLATVANETLFYVLPAEEFENGGYEYGGCMLAPGADRIIIGGCHKLLKRVYGELV